VDFTYLNFAVPDTITVTVEPTLDNPNDFSEKMDRLPNHNTTGLSGKYVLNMNGHSIFNFRQKDIDRIEQPANRQLEPELSNQTTDVYSITNIATREPFDGMYITSTSTHNLVAIYAEREARRAMGRGGGANVFVDLPERMLNPFVQPQTYFPKDEAHTVQPPDWSINVTAVDVRSVISPANMGFVHDPMLMVLMQVNPRDYLFVFPDNIAPPRGLLPAAESAYCSYIQRMFQMNNAQLTTIYPNVYMGIEWVSQTEFNQMYPGKLTWCIPQTGIKLPQKPQVSR
jgi:hypothetical protein